MSVLLVLVLDLVLYFLCALSGVFSMMYSE